MNVLRGTEDEERTCRDSFPPGNMVRTLFRLSPSLQLIPCWEGQRADPEEKQGLAKDIKCPW